MKDYAKTNVILTALILVVLIGILVAFVFVALMLKDTLQTLEPTINEATATLENAHSITDKINELMPQIEESLLNNIKDTSTMLLDLFRKK